MRKNIKLKGLTSFALSSLFFCLTSCGNLSAKEKKEKKKSSSSPVLPIVTTVFGISAIGTISWISSREKPPGENPKPKPKPIEDPKPKPKPVVQNIDITKETKTKLEDIYLWRGDITTLTVDAIVNAANCSLLGGDAIDGAIHKAAGPQLLEECRTLNGCETGKAKITKGYNLPSKHVIHTVGPIVGDCLTQNDRDLLTSCYKSSLELASKNNLNSIAFCCISTGYYNFPKEEAAKIAIETVKSYKSSTNSKMKIIFDVFTDEDEKIYKNILL